MPYDVVEDMDITFPSSSHPGNDSSLIAYTARFLAEVRGEDPQTLVDRCTENALRLFFPETA